MGSTVRLSLTVLLLAASLVSQEYRAERDEALGIEFLVHNKLSRQPGAENQVPRLLYRYEPEDIGDFIHTKHRPFPWFMLVLSFPKDVTGIPEPRIQARTFREWATVADPGIDDRTIVVEGDRKRARGKTMEHVWWEYRDTIKAEVRSSGSLRGLEGSAKEIDQPFHYVAAVYDLPDKELALLGVIPIKDYRTFKPDTRYMGYLSTMATSLRVFEPTAPATGELSPRDNILRQLQKVSETEPGWDFVPGETHGVLYSWDPERAARKRDGERFAQKVTEHLERLQELFTAELPAHPKQVLYFPVARICYDYQSFMHRSGSSEAGAVAEFNNDNQQLTLFYDKARERVRSEADLMAALTEAAWRQHAFFYFHVQTPVDLHRWYEMGLAAWFASHQVSSRRTTYRPDRDRSRIIRAAVDDGSYRNLEEFLTLGADEFDGRGREENEAQAWAFVDFLKRGADQDGFDTAWGRILDTYRMSALEKRSPRTALSEAIEGIDLVALEAAWVDWVKNELR